MTSPPAVVAAIAAAKSRHGAPIAQAGLLTPIVDTNVRCEAPCASVATKSAGRMTKRLAKNMNAPERVLAKTPRKVLVAGAAASSTKRHAVNHPSPYEHSRHGLTAAVCAPPE